ncbi:MAG: dTMP kinase [Enterobacterales bacterium]
MKYGKFIVIEGIDGSGKTSAVSHVVNVLHDYGIKNIICTHEPGGTLLGEKLRSLIKTHIYNEKINNYSELLMIYASRVQLVENVIKPSLYKGIWVVSDRYNLSSQAYQAGGRKIDMNVLNTLFNLTLKNFLPDLTLYLDVPVKIGLSRIYNRLKKSKSDRIESESINFFERTRKKYKELSVNNNKIITINANNKLNLVHYEIKMNLIKWLNKI